MTTEIQTSIYQPVGEIAVALEERIAELPLTEEQAEQLRRAYQVHLKASILDEIAEKLTTMTRAENLLAQPVYKVERYKAVVDAVFEGPSAPVIEMPQGITRRGQRTVLKAERKQLASRLCGAFVEGRRLNRAERRFAARQLRFA